MPTADARPGNRAGQGIDPLGVGLVTLTCERDPEPVACDDGGTAAVLLVRVTNPAGPLLDRGVMADLDVLGRRLATQHEVRALVITGPAPGVFVPHYRLAEIAEGAEALGAPVPYALARASLAAVGALGRIPGVAGALERTPAGGVVELLRTQAALDRLGRLPQVVVAAIGGDALGGGCELALACDVRVMARGPYAIGLPEVSAGIPPGAGGTQRLARVLGPGRARSLILRSRVLDPEEALAAGLVDELAEEEEVEAAALAVARRCARRSPAAVAGVKRALHGGRSLHRGLMVEAASFMAVAARSDAVRRLREFDAASSADGARTPWRDRSWIA